MRQGHGRPTQRKETLHVTPFVLSKSLGVITPPAGSADNIDLSSSGLGYSTAKSQLSTKQNIGAHLPPLGRQYWRPPIRLPTHPLHRKESNRLNPDRTYHFDSSVVRCPSIDSPVSESDWAAVVVDLFIPVGEAAGITFQWTTTPTPGLFVVGVAEGSVAARHGSIVRGMLLLEINGHQVTRMSQDETTRSMRSASMKSRVLTLACTPWSLLTGHYSPRRVNQPEGSSSSPSVRSNSAIMGITLKPPFPGERPHSASSPASCLSRSTRSSSDGETSSASSSSIIGSSAYVEGSVPDGTNLNRLQDHMPLERLLALRFVESQGNTLLYDRDHVLGLKKREIEFVPSGSCSNTHHANSRRSLGELTLDWRNDPFSTPARRRRLINDVCRLVASSYAHAAVSRVAEFRREESFVVRIQAAARMWSIRNRFRIKLAERGGRAALILQLSWLAHTARRRMRILREERDIARSVEEIARKNRLMREHEERRCRREEERLRIEKENTEQALVVLLQRRVRAIQAHRRLMETKRTQDQQRAAHVSKAEASFKAVICRWRRRREVSIRILRDKIVAASLLQQTWRQCGMSTMNRRQLQRSDESHAPGSKSSYRDRRESDPVDKNHAGPTSRDALTTADDLDKASASPEIWPPDSPNLTSVLNRQASGIDASGFDHYSRLHTTTGTAVESIEPRAALQAPPAGMMAVRVKIGPKQRNWFTPVVLRENDQTASEVSTGTASNSDSVENGGRQWGDMPSTTAVAAAGELGTGVVCVTPDNPAAGRVQPSVVHPREPATKLDGRAVKLANMKTETVLVRSHAEASIDRAQGDGNRRSFLASFEMPRSQEQFSTCNKDDIEIGQEQCIMDDSQLYLSCALCGLKYLVESVDARLPESGQGQPAAQILYLCTNCGGTLREGEDGRWRRRRRPSSAPALGRSNPLYELDSRRLKESYQAFSERSSVGDAFEEEHSETIAEDEPREFCSRGRSTMVIKRRYARCARIIQLAYRNFRHRQYLHNWALSLLRRWFPGRIEALRRAERRLLLYRAAVVLQSFVRTVFARARSSLLRTARRRLWVDRAVALWDADVAVASPGATELLRNLHPPQPPPRPSVPSLRESVRCHLKAGGGEPYRVGDGRAMAEALAPTIKGPPPPGCPSPLEVDWGEWGVKLQLSFASESDTYPI